jgi:sugar phosphate isomerase/epimerase
MNPNQLYIHIPAKSLSARVAFLIEHRLQPEVACQDIELDALDFSQLEETAAQLQEQGLHATLHAPYQGYKPGSGRAANRAHSHALTEKSLQLAEILRAKRVIFHPGLAQGNDPRKQEVWLTNSLAFWPQYLGDVERIDTVLCIENIYAPQPHILKQLLDTIDSPYFGHVFDVGHWNLFATIPVLEWLEQMAPHLKHLHLHDNRGDHDSHQAIGSGTVPFTDLFDWLALNQPAATITLENHNLTDALISLQQVKDFFSPSAA